MRRLRSGAGSIPWSCRIRFTVVRAISWPRFESAPRIRVYPHWGFSTASRTTSAATSRRGIGRPRAPARGATRVVECCIKKGCPFQSAPPHGGRRRSRFRVRHLLKFQSAPPHRGGVGARSLNIELQAALNPAGEEQVERFGRTFSPGDKVMQIENDRFYVLRWPELQRVLINGYRAYLERHGGRRPRRTDSFHTALREPDIKPFLGNWLLFDAFT